jgi:tetratricopeptide (TPR) repeat protein
VSARVFAFRIAGLSLAAVFAAGVPDVLAAEDGGTRSVFASGAGNRAIAMGSAFVGIADDASAMIWNPGGLGTLQRLEFQAAHSGYGDLESREEYLAAVLPDWRWGTVGLSVRHFGTGSIDPRDDRNLPLGSDLSSSESEIAVGFGRSISAALNVGGAVKLQRQTVAGASGTGLGADLGFLARPAALLHAPPAWLDRVTWGLSVRNVVQPSLRLDQESVRDPAVLRTGIAYAHPIFAGRRTLFALDLEKSGGIGARLHMGVEMRVHPLLGLRTGWSEGALSAGAAFSWRGLSLDYAYQDAGLTAVHRFGISRPLGRTVSERREAASAAREKAIQARLDEAFQRREAEQLDSLLAQAQSAEDRGDLVRAQDLLSTVAILYPGDQRLAAQQARVRGKVESEQRAERERSAISGEAARRRVAHTADSLAADSAARHNTLAARERAKVPERRASVAPQPAASRSTAPPASGRASAIPANEIAAMYQAGLRASSQRRSEEARRYWEIVWYADPDYGQVREYLKREYLMSGMELFAAGKLEEAVDQWEKVLQVDPSDRRAAGYISRARTQQSRSREIVGDGR